MTLTLMLSPDAPCAFTMKTAFLLTSTALRPSPDAVTELESTISSVYGEPARDT